MNPHPTLHTRPPAPSRRAALKALAGLAASGTGFAALAQAGGGKAADAWSPKGPVRIVVPFAAGGTSDIIARLLNGRLAEALGQPVVIENRAGAGGSIGITTVARAAPDGQTLLLVSSSFVTNPALYPDKKPYDPIRQFLPISLVAVSPDVIVVRKNSPITSLADLIARAKARRGELTYATPGKGNSVHLGGEFLWHTAGIEMLHVPYNGAAPAVTAVLSGQVDCALVALPAAKAQIAAGALRALTVGGAQRWAQFPDVPTVAESGFPGYRSETMQALFAPASTPASTIERIGAEVRLALAQPAVLQQMREMGFDVVASSPAVLAARVAEEVPRWAAVATKANIRAD